MSVILLILKIIGITLLVILALILVLALLVIFLPVRYRVTGSITKEWQVGVKVNASWLFHLVFFQFRQREKESTAVVRIFGIPIRLFPKKEKDGKKDKKNKEDKNKEKKNREEKNIETKNIETKNIENRNKNNNGPEHSQKKQRDEKNGKADVENYCTAIGDNSRIEQQDKIERDVVEKSKDSDTVSKRNLFAKILQLWHRFLQMLTSIKNTAKNLVKTVRHIFTRTGSIKEMILDETNRKASQLILKELLYVLGHYKPRKIKSKLAFSLGDPATTGQVLGALSVLPIMYRYQIEVYPDFMEETLYVEGTFFVSGRVRMIHLIRSAIHIWRDENTKHLIGQIRA